MNIHSSQMNSPTVPTIHQAIRTQNAKFSSFLEGPNPDAKLAVENFDRIQLALKEELDRQQSTGYTWGNYTGSMQALGSAAQATGVSIKYMA